MSPLIAVDHVQLAMPAGGEDAARAFYAGVLGLDGADQAAAPRSPRWLLVRGWPGEAAPRRGGRLPPGTQGPSGTVGPRLARAFVDSHHLDVRWSYEIPGTVRCHVDDPFGNRLELIDAAHARTDTAASVGDARTDTAGPREAGPP